MCLVSFSRLTHTQSWVWFVPCMNLILVWAYAFQRRSLTLLQNHHDSLLQTNTSSCIGASHDLHEHLAMSSTIPSTLLIFCHLVIVMLNFFIWKLGDGLHDGHNFPKTFKLSRCWKINNHRSWSDRRRIIYYIYRRLY